MAYFLKVQTKDSRVYLAIYESFYSPESKDTKHRCYKPLGNVEKLKAAGIEDPIAYGKEEVRKLNEARNASKVALISDEPVLKHLGYFPLKALIEKLDVKKIIDLFKFTNYFQYDLYSLITSLIYARAVCPCSNYKTYFEVIPSLFEKTNFSYDQQLDGLAFLGNDYKKFLELFYSSYKNIYGSDTSKAYFDCTNFYFEIDKEDDFRKKGPSKENRKDPIIGMGLLLDADQIPVWMSLYPGNQSEKPVLREVIKEVKDRDQDVGKIIHVADKGLNCAENIAFSKENNDGYIFSKSVKMLPEKEKVWVTLNQDWKEVRDSDGSLLYLYKSCIDNFPYKVQRDGKTVKVDLKEKRLATYNPTLARKQNIEITKQVEKARSLCLSRAKKAEFGECSKFVNFKHVDRETGEIDDDSIALSINEEKIKQERELAGYNLIVTSEIKIPDKELYKTYHNLWRIEESFKVMKSELDARPVFVQKEETIKGHFLICYLTVMLERILQLKIYKGKYSSTDLYDFFKYFTFVEANKEFINTSKSTKFITEYAEETGLPLNHLKLSETKLKKILNYKL